MVSVALPQTNSFNYIDGILAVWLIVGAFRGRKQGMAQGVLPTAQWILIVALAGLFYQPLANIILNNTNGAFTRTWANVTGYALIAFAVHLFFLWIKQAVGEKLAGSDYFGRAEYYLGMIAGVFRFACMAIVVVALMHSRVYSDAELAENDKVQKKNFEDIQFPTYMSIQHSVLKGSFAGRELQQQCPRLLIASSTDSKTNSPAASPAKKREDSINEIIAPAKK